MNKKINPWMLATIFLLGLIIGFMAGRFTIGPVQTAANILPKGTGNNGAVAANNIGNAQPQQTIQTTPENSYANIAKSVDATGHYSLGDKNAKVKIMEFSDFQCPFCYRFFTGAYPQILKDYVATGKVYYSYYNFPLNIHPQAPAAANASLCAAEQDKFWEFHDLLFSNQNMWSGNDNADKVFETLGQAAGLDGGKFTQCMSSNKFAATVAKDTATGDSKGISGTPTLFVNDQKIVGAQDYYSFKKAIEDELNKK